MHGTPFQEPIFPLHVDHFLLVVGHIDVGWGKFTKCANRFQKGLDISALQGWDQFKGKQGFLCLIEDVDYLHGFSIPYH